MAIDFPNSPSLNQTYTVGSKTWSYDGEKWVLSTEVTLGTDTAGNYVASLVAGTGITLTNGTASEGGTPTITNAGVTSVNGSTGAITGVVTTADTGTVTSTMIADGTIVNADINSAAAIDLTKLSTTGASSGYVVRFNGTSWIPDSTGGLVSATSVNGGTEDSRLEYSEVTLDTITAIVDGGTV